MIQTRKVEEGEGEEDGVVSLVMPTVFQMPRMIGPAVVARIRTMRVVKRVIVVRHRNQVLAVRRRESIHPDH